VEPTKPEAAAQPDRLLPSDTAVVAEVVKPEPPTSIGLRVGGTPESVSPLDQSTPSEVTTQADPIEPELMVPKAHPSTELPASTAKPEALKTASPIRADQAPTPSGEVASSIKLEGIPVMAEPQTQVEPTKPEAAAQPDRLLPSDTAVVAEVVKPEPLIGIGLGIGGSSESVSPLNQPTLLEVTTQADPIELETVIPNTQSSLAETPAALIKPEIGSTVKADQPFSPSGEVALSAKPSGTQPVSVVAEPSQVAHAATAVAQEAVPHRIKIVTPRTVQSRGYSVSSEPASLSNMEEGKANSLSEPKAKEAPMFLSSWTPEKRDEKFQPVAEISENKPEDSFQKVFDKGLENLVVQTDVRQSVQPKSEPLPTQTMYLPQKGPDALPHGLVQVVRHVMADGTQKATVIIDPPALGRVEVEVRATSTGIEASFKVDSAQVREMIKPQIPVLQDMLSQQGIVASSISVDIRQGDERRSPWRDSLDSIKLRRRKGASEEEELEIPLMDTARLDMERGVLQWYA
ncbi:flagellar hook-length control protein FliK, partial [Dethiosulfovibrio salsuginis]